ncbi:MFS transporter [Nakamurella leprariae]|uniref:MFS transporter n=1 Tax=Nakamurella leprariae TaxID=2803911 RepID=A0A939BZQ6_9ACTN|nr:MFS transporter [Nakamurella leprariae]MBM9467951.1 MFS transporter [Nakamurella leprariae]
MRTPDRGHLPPLRLWSMLALGMGTQAAGAVFTNGVAFLLPTLHEQRGLSLAAGGVVVAMPTVGVLFTLIAWGALADAVGERLVLALGGILTAAAGLGAVLTADAGSLVPLSVFLLLGGAGAASANAASGRVVVGWFPAERRGTVMGLRQMAQPLGVGLAALTVPGLAEEHGIGAALLVPTVLTAVAGICCALWVLDPPRPVRAQAAPELTANPYRTDRRLWRIHGVSVLLVVPQFVVWTFTLTWLITERSWSAAAAGVLVTVTQLLGAAGRVAAGIWSDRVHSRMRPLRTVAVAIAVVMATLAVTDALDWGVAVVVLVLATVVTVAPNGLAFTAVAEIGGPFWAGRALGAQNTAQFLAGSAVPPAIGALVGVAGYPAGFGVAALLAAAAVPLVPLRRRGDRPD